MLKTGLAAIAALMLAGPAGAQSDTTQFRPLTVTGKAAALVSPVSGPQNARRLLEVLVLRTQSDSGADAFVGSFLIDCTSGAVTVEHLTSCQAGKQVNDQTLDPPLTVKVEPETIYETLRIYACTGKTDVNDDARPVGVAAAMAHGAEMLK